MGINYKKYIPKGSENISLLKNSIGAICIKGGGMVLSIIAMPLYMRYFPDKTVLGIWFTILNVLNWILTFDLGIGNGLRNHLTIALSKDDESEIRSLISSAYILLGLVTLFITLCLLIISKFVDWNTFFNVSVLLIPKDVLAQCVSISLIGVLVSFFLRLVFSILYALQKTAFVNAISFITSICTVVYLLVVPTTNDILTNFRNLSILHAVALNLPLLVATIFVFSGTRLKSAMPSLKYFKMSLAKKILSLGITFLFLQLLYMIITVTNEWFISKFYAPQYCVDYQIYQRIFSLIGSFYMLALTPLWSAITKALAEKRYHWITKVRRLLYLSMIPLTIIQLLMVPILPWILHIWIGDQVVAVDIRISLAFVIYSILFSWIAIQSTIVAGLGKLKVQLYGYIIAVIIKVCGIVFLSEYITNWIFVVLITCVSLLPYCIAEPIAIKKTLQQFAN